MSTDLRAIALTVAETDAGRYIWVLLESSGPAGVYDLPVDRSAADWPSYSEALREGAGALMQLSLRSPHGPRAEPVKNLKWG